MGYNGTVDKNIENPLKDALGTWGLRRGDGLVVTDRFGIAVPRYFDEEQEIPHDLVQLAEGDVLIVVEELHPPFRVIALTGEGLKVLIDDVDIKIGSVAAMTRGGVQS
jgi:hypothetical protein